MSNMSKVHLNYTDRSGSVCGTDLLVRATGKTQPTFSLSHTHIQFLPQFFSLADAAKTVIMRSCGILAVFNVCVRGREAVLLVPVSAPAAV